MLQRGILLNIAINNTLLIFEIAYHDDLLTKSTPRYTGDLLQNNPGKDGGGQMK